MGLRYFRISVAEDCRARAREEIFPETDFRAKRRHHGFDGVHQIDERLKLVEAAFFRCSA
ncbi:hypothetical protein MESMUL_22930 [Mesosutterella multiformis]|uniref:Uncharacterized protein n=1 Tax=Mesosutterella multiformis TaxID=2259133 RepID=A0A388SHJ5_9BURK|nr:hypothetical protein MESMUL_22930 [Mesosutterella multiformis]